MDALESQSVCSPTEASVLVFGPFALHRASQQLLKGAQPVRIGSRAFGLLVDLVESAGQLRTRAQLEASVWPRSVVEETSLRVHMSALRRALGDGVDGVRYIANVPGRGYSFVAAVARVAAQAHVALPSPAPCPAPGPADRIDNLPTRLTCLIGRDANLAMLAAELAQRRLVSIVGHGGIGKTSLAVAVAARVREHFPAGICFVDLAPLTAPSHVIENVVSALGLDPAWAAGPQWDELADWLRPRRLLLVLDNCEHLLDTVAAFVERILKRAPDLVVLATSREPIDAQGEWVHRLQPLAAPPEDPPIDSAGALGFSAVRLLAERAAASLDSFTIDAGNVHLAAALCRRLDGVPLAIEFAASRIGLLGLQGVYMQLDDRLRLLGSGRRTALPRHRTLRALLDWSYALLAPAQQDVLRRCGVFKGGFSLEAAGAVIADADLPAAVVGDCLLELVAKSLVRVDLAHFPPSYSLLEITRAYALEQLGTDPLRPDVQRRHARYMLTLVERRAAEGADTVHPSALSYPAHVGNFRAALDWCFGADGDPAIGIALLGTDSHPMALYLGESEYRLRAGQALDAIAAGVPADPILEVRIFSVFHYISARDGDQAALQRLLDVAAQEADPDAQLEALYQLHAHHFGRGNYHLCEGYAHRSEVAATRCGAAEMLHVKRLRALVSHYRGEHGLAADHASALLETDDHQAPLRLSGWLPRRVSMQIVMARVLWMQGRGGQAIMLAADCVRNAEAARFPAALSQALCLAALPVALWQGEDERAHTWLQQLQCHLSRCPQQYWTAWLEALQQVVAMREVRAMRAVGGAAPVQDARLPQATDAKLLDHLATLGVRQHHAQAFARWRGGMVGWTGPELLRVEGERLLDDDPADAAGAAQAAFMHALALAGRQQAHAWVLRATLSLARLRRAQGRRDDARVLLLPWLDRLDAMGAGADAAETRRVLRTV